MSETDRDSVPAAPQGNTKREFFSINAGGHSLDLPHSDYFSLVFAQDKLLNVSLKIRPPSLTFTLYEESVASVSELNDYVELNIIVVHIWAPDCCFMALFPNCLCIKYF